MEGGLVLQGDLVKRSEWIRTWNTRRATVRAASAAAPATLTWHGGRTLGRVVLTGCGVEAGHRLIVHAAGRELHFKHDGRRCCAAKCVERPREKSETKILKNQTK